MRTIGDADVGKRLPSVRHLQKGITCSSATLTQAIRALQSEGVLSRTGRGRSPMIVSREPQGLLWLGGMQEFGEQIEIIGEPDRRTTTAVDDSLAKAAAQFLKLRDDQPMVLVERIRRLQERPRKWPSGAGPARRQTPMRWDRTYLPAHRLQATFFSVDLKRSGLRSSLWESGIRPQSRHFLMSAGLATPEEATKLGLPQREPHPVVRVIRESLDDEGEPVEYLYLVCYSWYVEYTHRGVELEKQ